MQIPTQFMGWRRNSPMSSTSVGLYELEIGHSVE